MKWHKLTGATGWQKMRERARTCSALPVVRRWTYTVEQGTYNEKLLMMSWLKCNK